MEMTAVNNEETIVTVGQLVADDYRKAEIFKKFGIDFCCGGSVSVNEICKKKGVAIEDLEKAFAELDTQQKSASQNYNTWELDFLVDYIVNTHHKYVASALPLLDEFSAKVARVHGEHHPEVIEIYHHYQAVANELRSHMQKEEMILFPYIKQMVIAKRNGEIVTQPHFGSIRNPINMMENEHESAGDSLKEVDKLSNNYTPPAEACNTFRVLYAKLQEFENDLHQHIHLENNILFPKAIAMEEELFSK